MIFGTAACVTAVCCSNPKANIGNAAEHVRSNANDTKALAYEIIEIADDEVIIKTATQIVFIQEDTEAVVVDIQENLHKVKNEVPGWQELLGEGLWVLGGGIVLMLLWRSGVLKLFRTVLGIFNPANWKKKKDT